MIGDNKKVKSRNSRFQHPLKPALILGVVLVVGFIGFKVYDHYHNKGTGTQDGPTAEQVQQAADVSADDKKDFIEQNDTNITDDPGDNPAPNATGTTIDLSAKKEADASVTIIAKLPGVSSGTCSLKIINGIKNASRSATVIYQPEFSTCAGFSIPVSELGSGSWNITLTLSGSSTGSKSITFEVN